MKPKLEITLWAALCLLTILFLFMAAFAVAGSPEIKHRMLVQMTAALSEAAGLPPTGIWIYISELPAQQMVEFGHILPEPGQEQAWNEALPAQDRDFMAKIGRSS